MKRAKKTPVSDATRRTLRSTAQLALTALVAMPAIVAGTGVDPVSVPGLTALLAVSAAITRLSANPTLEKYLPEWLRMQPPDGQ